MSLKRNSKEIIVIVSSVAAVVLFIILYLACKKKRRTKVNTRRYNQQVVNDVTVPVFIVPQVTYTEPVRTTVTPTLFPVNPDYNLNNQNNQPAEEYYKQPAYNPNFA